MCKFLRVRWVPRIKAWSTLAPILATTIQSRLPFLQEGAGVKPARQSGDSLYSGIPFKLQMCAEQYPTIHIILSRSALRLGAAVTLLVIRW